MQTKRPSTLLILSLASLKPTRGAVEEKEGGVREGAVALRDRLYDRIESYPWCIVLDFYNNDAIDAILLHHRQGQILVSRPVTLLLVKAPPIVTVFPEILVRERDIRN